MAVFEARPIGLGIGVARELGPDLGTLPSLHLRLGSLDRLHFQFDVAPPTPTLWTTGLARFGLGFNRGHRRGVGALVGAAIGPYSDEAYPLLGFAEISVPAGRRVDLLIRGTAGPGHQTTSRAAALGVRLRLDR